MRALQYISLFLLIGASGGAQSGSGTELIGLHSVALEPGERLWGFDIHLDEGRLIAVCNLPDGWKITAANHGESGAYKNGGGEVHGGADFGHDALAAGDLSKLGAFLLLGRSRVHDKAATLTGEVTTSGPTDNRTVRLRSQDFTRRVAEACPAPRLQ